VVSNAVAGKPKKVFSDEALPTEVVMCHTEVADKKKDYSKEQQLAFNNFFQTNDNRQPAITTGTTK
jgi:hypothetical protein